MANIKDIPLSGLLVFQQVIEFGSTEISKLFFEALDANEAKKINSAWFEEFEADLEKRLATNNRAVEIISREIRTRLKTVFPSITSPITVETYRKKYEKELRKKEGITPLDLTPSREKRK